MNPPTPWKLGNLSADGKRLTLSEGLTEFPDAILDLADSLEILDLSNNHLHRLPASFAKLHKLKIAFFTRNQFETFPGILRDCPRLSMVSFKGNALQHIPEGVLSPTIRWLILTDNQLPALPADMGHLGQLQKCMLAGNRLRALPEELANCQRLELIRLSANQLQVLPDWLLTLPRLAWLAYAGNPCARVGQGRSLPTVRAEDLQLETVLGQGTSGIIYKGNWRPASGPARPVAVKYFKSDITSDGLPLDEMQACRLAGRHPNLVNLLGQLDAKSDGKTGLVFSVIPADYQPLGNPPDFETCTRDTYAAGTVFKPATILRIAQGVAAAAAHLHGRGVMHGDLYAHNILTDPSGRCILSDFGAATVYAPSQATTRQGLENLEVRAFGCLLEELLVRHDPSCSDGGNASAQLERIRDQCLQLQPQMRPTFGQICDRLGAVAEC